MVISPFSTYAEEAEVARKKANQTENTSKAGSPSQFNLAAANPGDQKGSIGFASQASGLYGSGVLTVNQNDLSAQLNIPLSAFLLDALTPSPYQLRMISKSKDSDPYYGLQGNNDVTLNIPLLKKESYCSDDVNTSLKQCANIEHYYSFYDGNVNNTLDSDLSPYYTKIKTSDIQFSDNGKIAKYTDQNYNVYVFKSLSDESYRIVAIVTNKGKGIKFSFNDQKGFAIRNLKSKETQFDRPSKETFLVFNKSNGNARVSQFNINGNAVETHLSYDDSSVTLQNPEGKETIFRNQDNQMSLTLPTGMVTTLNHDTIKKINYKIQGGDYSYNLDQPHVYIKRAETNYNNDYYISHLSNDQVAKTIDYSVIPFGSPQDPGDVPNFLGNYMGCGNQVMTKLNPAKDFLMTCGFLDNKSKKGMLGDATGYSYNTHSKFNTETFDMANPKTPNSIEVSRQNTYNYLHLPLMYTTKVDNKVVHVKRHEYGHLYTSSFEELSTHYLKPNFTSEDIYNRDSTASGFYRMQSQFKYFDFSNLCPQTPGDPHQPTDDACGYLEGQVQQGIDALNRQVNYKYNPINSDNSYSLPIIQNKLVAYFDDDLNISSYTKTNNTQSPSEVNWISNTITLSLPELEEDIKLSFPDLKGVQHVYSSTGSPKDETVLYTKTVDEKELTNLGGLTYGIPLSASHKIGDNGHTVQESMKIQMNVSFKSDNDLIKVSSTHSVGITEKSAPSTLESTEKYYNTYGALLHEVDPHTKDEHRYEYDQMNRLVKMTFLPSGKEDLSQRVEFEYETIPGGYVTTMSDYRKTYNGSPYITKVYKTTTGQSTRVEATFPGQGLLPVKETYYNNLGLKIQTIDYTHFGTKIDPKITEFYYNDKQQLTAVKRWNGSWSIVVKDQYFDQGGQSLCYPSEAGTSFPCTIKNRHYAYHMTPTNISNESGLCKDPISGQNVSCKIDAVAIEHRVLSPIKDVDYRYNQDQNRSYSVKVPNQEAINATLSLDTLRNTADETEKSCFEGEDQVNCSALSANLSVSSNGKIVKEYYPILQMGMAHDYNKRGLPSKTDYIYETQWNDQFTNNPTKSVYLTYNDNDHLSKVEISEPDQDRQVVAEIETSPLGFILSQTQFIGGDKKTFEYYMPGDPDGPTGALKTISYADGSTKTIFYDPIWNKRSKVVYKNYQGQQFEVDYNYNDQGKPIKVTKTDGNNISSREYSYDHPFNSLSKSVITHPGERPREYSVDYDQSYTLPVGSTYATSEGSFTKNYTYNNIGLITQQEANGVKTTLEYDQRLRPKTSTISQGTNQFLITNYEYDDLHGLSTLKHQYGNGESLTYGYTYDKTGRKATTSMNRIADNGKKFSTQVGYTYSSMGQIEGYTCQESCPSIEDNKISNIKYTFDTLFNRIESVDIGSNVYTYNYRDDTNQPTLLKSIESTNEGTTTFTYDWNGNLMKYVDVKNDITTSLSYDVNQNMIGITSDDPNIDNVSYVYGAGSILEQTIKDGNTKNTYRGGGLIVNTLHNQDGSKSSTISALGGVFSGNTYEALLTDGSDVVGSLGLKGQLDKHQIFTPYGISSSLLNSDPQKEGLTSGNTQGYRGMSTDSVTGWQFLGNGYRAYNPNMRVFLKQDSWSPLVAGINGLSYSSNDPVNYFDPSGHITQKQMQTYQNKYHLAYARMGDVGAGWIIGGIAADLLITIATAGIGAASGSAGVAVLIGVVGGAAGALANDAIVDAGQALAQGRNYGDTLKGQMLHGGLVDIGMGAAMGGLFEGLNMYNVGKFLRLKAGLGLLIPVGCAAATQGIDIAAGYQQYWDWGNFGFGVLVAGGAHFGGSMLRNPVKRRRLDTVPHAFDVTTVHAFRAYQRDANIHNQSFDRNIINRLMGVGDNVDARRLAADMVRMSTEMAQQLHASRVKAAPRHRVVWEFDVRKQFNVTTRSAV